MNQNYICIIYYISHWYIYVNYANEIKGIRTFIHKIKLNQCHRIIQVVAFQNDYNLCTYTVLTLQSQIPKYNYGTR